MLKRLVGVAMAAGLCSPAFAQRPADHPPRQIGAFDQAPIREGLKSIKTGGSCTVYYVVGVDGKAKHIVPQCTEPEMAPYVVKTIEGATWEPEVFAGKVMDSDILQAAFRFGNLPPADPRGEKPPVLIHSYSEIDLGEALNRTPGALDRCDVVFTVGVDGKPKDIATNCKPPALDPLIANIIARMEYTPAEKAGRPTDWPGVSLPLEFKETANR
ncbi:MAG TPA: hypothetical protein VG942_15455 [Hyphomonadaceae bacterium]|nr:hypothetical protein [Hyphomonadaceae bacterium]